ncbi:MAG: putative monooxygenase [Bacillota bacterium]|nr:putative monooxygenase [Bacillota bacterium]
MIKVVAENKIKQNKIDEFLTLAARLREATNTKDEGCIHYDLYQDFEDPSVLTFLEEWESMEALEKHIAADHFKEIVPQFEPLVERKAMRLYKQAF